MPFRHEKEVTAYIDRMAHALRKAGFDKPILYNVTHNPGVTTAYYAAKDIDGTTYQWYPTGLVAGHERKGNFLPAIDEYTIPWKRPCPDMTGSLAWCTSSIPPTCCTRISIRQWHAHSARRDSNGSRSSPTILLISLLIIRNIPRTS